MFRKVLLTIGLLLVANVAVLAQGTLKGVITDAKSKEPVPFVNIVAKQNGQQVRGGQTDFDGKYTITPLSVGKYDIEVSCVGYKKYTRPNVQVSASGFTVVNVELTSDAINIDVVDIVDDRVPVIEIGTPESGSRLSSDDIAKMPGTSVESIVAAVGGVGYDDGGTGTARGEDNMVTMQGNVRKRTGVSVPKEAIAEIQVILGGTPASIGEAIGGTQIITLKPPSPKFKGSVTYEAWLDYRLANSLRFYLTGPVKKVQVLDENGGAAYDRALIGFRLNGTLSYTNSPMYRAKNRRNGANARYMMVNDELVRAIEDAPITYDPLTGAVNYTAETCLRADDFTTITRLRNKDFTDPSRKPDISSYSVALEGALDFRFSENATLTFSTEYDMSRSPSLSLGYFPLNLSRAGNGVGDMRNMVFTLDFTHRFPDQKTSSADGTEANTKPAISNVMYNITAYYNRYTYNTYNQNFGDNVFQYGHIGQFRTEKIPTYDIQSNYIYEGAEVLAHVQNSWRDDVTYVAPSPYNPVLAQYNNQIFGMTEIAPYLTNFDNIKLFKGLLNGDAPSSVYNMFSNVGVQSTGYTKQQNDYYYFQAKAQATIKDHDLEVGFQYDQYSEAYYGLNAYKLWGIMRQTANAHITQMDLDHPNYTWVGSELYVNYDRKVGLGQTQFDQSLRTYLSEKENRTVSDNEWLDIDNLLPEDYEAGGGLSMFSADDLFNSGNSVVSYYGYDHAGNKISSKGWSLDDFFASKDRTIPAFSPIYMAGYIQDKFFFQDLIFNVGVRVDYFDGNQWVLKDPYLLYESYTIGDLRENAEAYNAGNADLIEYNTGLENNKFPNAAKDDWVVYVDAADATTPAVTGYRSGSTWYNANGVEINSPSTISGNSGKPTPFRTKGENGGQNAFSNNKVNSSAFEQYQPAWVPMPRIAFSFPVGDNSQFKASYDIIARRPSAGWQSDYLSYLYMTQISTVNNPNLKPERITNYELGFQQALSKSAAVGISAYYKETRNLIQLVQYAGADPNQNYYSYDNLDFKTIKGFTFSYDLRQTKNLRINANYTLQYAEGTGLSTTTMSELIKEGYTTLKMLNPISDDRRHEFKANIDFRYFEGSKYNGPVWTRKVKDKETGDYKKKEIKVLENFGINMMAVAQSGLPYTRAFSNTQSTIVGSYRGARLPWGFYFNAVADKMWPIDIKTHDGKKKTTYLVTTITVNNLFDLRNIVGVFSVTGNPDDNGYLTDPETQSVINQQLDPSAYRDLYSIYLSNATWNYSQPRMIKLGLTYQF